MDSYVVLFNASASQSILPRADFVFENGGRISRVPLTVPTLKPLQSVEIDLGDLQKDARVPQDISSGTLVINYGGPEGFLMGRVFGIADNPTYLVE